MAKRDSTTRAEGFDLFLERRIDAPPALVWAAWTEPEHFKKWFAPAPLTVPDCTIELWPGGAFDTVMRGPDGTEYGGKGCFLEVVEHERLTFTDALEAGWRPADSSFMTAIIRFEALPNGGTAYSAQVLHKSQADREKHEEMGFHEGWATCAQQLADLAVQLKEAPR